MSQPKRIPRRDRCYLVGMRAAHLTPAQAAQAWLSLATQLQDLGDVAGPARTPKFRDVIAAIRAATITAKVKS